MPYRRWPILAAAVLLVGAAPAAALDWQRFSGTTVTLELPEHPASDGIRRFLSEFETLTGIRVAPGGDGADIRLLPLEAEAFGRWRSGAFLPLGPYLDDPDLTAADYAPGDFDARARLMDDALPVALETTLLFYNHHLVGAHLMAGLPPSTYHLVDAATLIRERSAGEAEGAVMAGSPSPATVATATALVINACGPELPAGIWFDAGLSMPRVTEPCIATGLAQYAGLLQAGPPGLEERDLAEAARFFREGRAGFFIGPSSFGPSFEDEAHSAVAGAVGYALLPPIASGRRSQSGHRVWALAIDAGTAEPEAAWYLVQWLTSPAIEPLIATSHGAAPRRGSLDDSGYGSALHPEFAWIVQESLAGSRSTIVDHERWPAMAEAIVRAIHAMHGATSREEAAAALELRLAELLDEAG